MSDVTDAPPFDPTQPFDIEGPVRLSFAVDQNTGKIVPGQGGPGSDGTAPPFDPNKPFQTSGRTLSQELGRQVGLTGRYAVEGLASIPAMVGDAANAGVNLATRGINAVTGSKIPALPPVSSTISNRLTAIGLPNPETPTERVVGDVSRAVASVPAFADTAAATGIKSLEPLAQNIGQQMTSAAGAAGASGTAREAGAPVWAQVLSGLVGGTVGALRFQPKAGVQDRIAAFDKAGVAPSVGDTTQSPFWQWVHKVVNATPFADNVVAANEAGRVGDAASQAGDIASAYGDAQSPQAAGEAAQNAVEQYRFGARDAAMTDHDILTQPTRNSSIATKAGVLYSRVPIPADAQIDVTKTAEALNSAVNAYDNPELAKTMADPKLAKWADILGNADNKLSWSDLQRLRTDVRYLQGKAALDPTIDDRALAQIGSALTDDMYSGASQVGGQRAADMVKRANTYYGLAMQGVTDKLKSVFGTNRPEGVFSQIQSAISANPNKADIGKLTELQRVMPKDEWGNLAATVIDGLGRPNPGTAIAPDAPQFSVAKFVTGYNQISPQAKDLLFNEAGHSDLRGALDNLSRVLALMKTSDKFANVSNTANLASRAGWGTAAGGAAWSALHGNLAPAAALGAGLGTANITARAMYNPAFVRLMAQGIGASPAGRMQTVAQIARFAMENPALAEDSRQLIRGIAPAPAQTDSDGQAK